MAHVRRSGPAVLAGPVPSRLPAVLGIAAVAFAVALCGLLSSPGAGTLRAQAPGQPAVPEAPAVSPPPPPSAPAGVGPSLPVPTPALSPLPPPQPPAPALPVRFRFEIKPGTPLQELLPEAPRGERRRGELFPADLTRVPEVMFQAPLPPDVTGAKATEKTAHQIAKINHLNQKKSDAFLVALLAQRSDLAGLPFAMGEACRTRGERSRQFNFALATVRQALQNLGGGVQFQAVTETVQQKLPDGTVQTVPVIRRVAVATAPTPQNPGQDSTNAFWDAYQNACTVQDRASAGCGREEREHVTLARIAALTQVLAPESLGLRLGLVKYLAGITHPEATRALARLAIFSAEDEVARAAVEALRVRRERDYTDVLVQGLRYPWPAVARRAGEAIVQLERQDLLPQLVAVLEEEDPRAPAVQEVGGKRVPTVRELVRVNHHRNCLMCHAPGNTPEVSPEAVTAEVPVPGEPLPTPASGYQNSNPDVLVRVDVTYLRQDFSVKLPVPDAAPWPEMQRFDYLVRTRALSEEEARAYREEAGKREPGVLSPYHRTALVALRELTGRDTEPTAQAWRRLLNLPPRQADATP